VPRWLSFPADHGIISVCGNMCLQYINRVVNIANQTRHLCVAFERQLRWRDGAQGKAGCKDHCGAQVRGRTAQSVGGVPEALDIFFRESRAQRTKQLSRVIGKLGYKAGDKCVTPEAFQIGECTLVD
jgi:hypothetical protein